MGYWQNRKAALPHLGAKMVSTMKFVTLAEFSNMVFTTPAQWETTTILVFTDEESAYNYMQDKLCGTEHHDSDTFCVINSEMKAETYLKENVAQSKVWKIYAIKRDMLAVVIELKKEK